ncbi:MAG: phage tail tube protein [bacterium]
MAAISGTTYAVFQGATTTTVEANRLFSCKNSSLKVDVDLPDVTTKDSAGWLAHLVGNKNWSIDFDGVYDTSASATTITPDELMAAFIAQTGSTICSFIPKIVGVATAGWTGLATIKGLVVTGDLATGITFSGSFVGNGALALFAA